MSRSEGAADEWTFPWSDFPRLYALHYKVSNPMEIQYAVYVFKSFQAAQKGFASLQNGTMMGSGSRAPENPHPAVPGELLRAMRDEMSNDINTTYMPYSIVAYRNFVISVSVNSERDEYLYPGIKLIKHIDAVLVGRINAYAVQQPNLVAPTPYPSPLPTSTPDDSLNAGPGVHVCSSEHFSKDEDECRVEDRHLRDPLGDHIYITGINNNNFTSNTATVTVTGRRPDGSMTSSAVIPIDTGTAYNIVSFVMSDLLSDTGVYLEKGVTYTVSVQEGKRNLGLTWFVYDGPSITPPPTPTPVPPPPPVQICTFKHFDQTSGRCLHGDTTLSLSDRSAVIVFTEAKFKDHSTSLLIPASGINILEQDGTGAWVEVGTGTTDSSLGVNSGLSGNATPRLFETVSHAIASATGVGSPTVNITCGDSVRFEVVDMLNKVIGTAPVTFTCG